MLRRVGGAGRFAWLSAANWSLPPSCESPPPLRISSATKPPGFDSAGFLIGPRKMNVTTVSTTRIDAAPIVQPISSFVLPLIWAGGSPPRRQRNFTSE